MILKQTFKNHIIPLEFTLSVTLLLLCSWWYFRYNTEGLLYAGGLYYLLFTIPSLYLHIEYMIRNAGEEIEINYNELIVRKKGNEQRYSNKDLSKIIVYKSASHDKGGIPLSAMEGYYYARIFAKTGREIIITCLMSRKIDEDMKLLTGVPYERKKGFFCTLSWK